MPMRIDLNCDLGESFGRYQLADDAALMHWITSANIACGLHAGDPLVMEQTVRLAVKHGVNIGAHPGYPDLQGFGRREMNLALTEVEAFVLYQLGALAAFTQAAGVELAHVKPHGALYNQAARDRALAQAIAQAVKRFDRSLILVGLAGSALIECGTEAGLRVANEGFPDRTYNPDGTLMSRQLPGAVIDSPEQVAAHALQLVSEGIRFSAGSQTQPVQVETLCLHGDTPNAPLLARAVREALTVQGVEVTPMGK